MSSQVIEANIYQNWKVIRCLHILKWKKLSMPSGILNILFLFASISAYVYVWGVDPVQY